MALWLHVAHAHLPAVWIGNWQILASFLHCSADTCYVGPARTRTCPQLSRLPTGQTRSQMSGQTLDNPVTWQEERKRVRERKYDKNRKIKIRMKMPDATHRDFKWLWLTLLGSIPFTCRSWSRLHWDLRTKAEEPSNCFTFVIEISAGFLLVTE